MTNLINRDMNAFALKDLPTIVEEEENYQAFNDMIEVNDLDSDDYN